MPILDKRKGDDILALVPASKRTKNEVVFSSREKAVVQSGPPRTSSLMSMIMLLEGHQGDIFSLEFHPEGQYLASTGFDRQIFIWNVYGECENIGIMTGHSGAVMELHFSPDGNHLYTASTDMTLGLWDIVAGTRIKKLKGHTSFVNSVSGARRGPTLLCSGSDDSTIRIWDPRKRGQCHTLNNTYQVTAVTFNDTAEQVISGGIDNDVKVWDLRKNAVLYKLKGHTDTITGLSLSPDGSYILSNAMDNMLKIWDVRPFAPYERCVKILSGHQHNFEKNLLRCAWSPDGSKVSAGSSDRFHYIWDTTSRRILYKLPGHNGSVNDIDFHPKEHFRTHFAGSKTAARHLWSRARALGSKDVSRKDRTYTRLVTHAHACIRRDCVGELIKRPFAKMADGRESRLFPTKSLYELCVHAVADKFRSYKPHLVDLPKNVRFDLYYQLFRERKLCILGTELSDLDTCSKMLKVTNRRIHLLQIFQAPMYHGIRVGKNLATGYNLQCLQVRGDPTAQDKIISLGLRLGGFLSDAGWYSESEEVLLACKQLCIANNQTPEDWCRTLDCCHKLLHAQAAYCTFDRAAETHQLAIEMIEQLKNAQYNNSNHAALFAEFSVLFFIRSEYDQAYRWSIEALKHLKPSLPARVIIDVLRQAAKSCVVKREFQKAGLLIREAVYLAREIFDTDHPKYSDVLIDYGFYLLNYDSIINSVSVYKTALDIRRAIFGKTNLHVALAHEDLAYALYVYEYSSGKFDEASDHAGIAIDIMEKLLPPYHLMLASAKRVKALILEEIAIDNASTPLSEQNLLLKSECLHLSALHLAKTAFGERNVQTAKHYGNLGRLYQSMRKFEEAEAMHLKAIRIKEELLGPEDYEVGLSIGHLASLYNFHMNRYRDAEKLYYRSIAISLKLFGKSYSGLEYDYRGLLHVYNKLDEYEKILEYTDTLNHWKELRDKHAQSEDPPIDVQKRPQPIASIINVFFSM